MDLMFIFGGIAIGLGTASVILTVLDRPKAKHNGELYRYTVVRLGWPTEVLDAADADTDNLDVQTVHFLDHDGNSIAIYSHVLKVTSLKAPKNV